MSTELRLLSDADLPALMEFISVDPFSSIYIGSRVAVAGLEPKRLGTLIVGHFRRGELTNVCMFGSNLSPVGSDEEGIAAIARQLGNYLSASSILGSADAVLPLYENLCSLPSSQWGSPREVRSNQPLLATNENPTIAGDERIQPVTMRDYDDYYRAAVAMYTEEVGSDPNGAGYRSYVRSLINNRHAFAGIHDGHVWFKADVGATWADLAQFQGVWMDPKLRGQGLSVAAMAQAIRLMRRTHPLVTLYVNDFNTAARRLYARLGFIQVGTMATVLYD